MKIEIISVKGEKMKTPDILEELADLQHEIWSHWMKYLFSKSDTDSGCETIEEDDARRWKRQMNTPYSKLSEKEKESDRDQARKIIKLLDAIT